jgi:hypothetical protein
VILKRFVLAVFLAPIVPLCCRLVCNPFFRFDSIQAYGRSYSNNFLLTKRKANDRVSNQPHALAAIEVLSTACSVCNYKIMRQNSTHGNDMRDFRFEIGKFVPCVYSKQ